MNQVKALWKVRTAEFEAVAVLREIRENGGLRAEVSARTRMPEPQIAQQ
jgi:hypothetical protein